MKRGSGKLSPEREALQAIARDAGRARMGDRAKEQPTRLMISLGLAPAGDVDEDEEDEDEEIPT